MAYYEKGLAYLDPKREEPIKADTTKIQSYEPYVSSGQPYEPGGGYYGGEEMPSHEPAPTETPSPRPAPTPAPSPTPTPTPSPSRGETRPSPQPSPQPAPTPPRGTPTPGEISAGSRETGSQPSQQPYEKYTQYKPYVSSGQQLTQPAGRKGEGFENLFTYTMETIGEAAARAQEAQQLYNEMKQREAAMQELSEFFGPRGAMTGPPPPGGGGGRGGGGGGGAPGGGGGIPTTKKGEATEPLGEIAWWSPDQVPAQIRQWGEWLRGFIEMNKLSPPDIPFTDYVGGDRITQAAEAIWANRPDIQEFYRETWGPPEDAYFEDRQGWTPREAVLDWFRGPGVEAGEVEEDADIWDWASGQGFVGEEEAEALGLTPEGEIIRTTEETGFRSTETIMKDLEMSLGLDITEDMTPTEKWQAFISAIPEASIEAQQDLMSLAYDPEVGWYTRDVRQLFHPEYM